METDESTNLIFVRQATCDHQIHRSYTHKSFDILNGFEFVFKKCINCHKTLELEVNNLS
jgi:hypothetical protein